MLIGRKEGSFWLPNVVIGPIDHLIVEWPEGKQPTGEAMPYLINEALVLHVREGANRRGLGAVRGSARVRRLLVVDQRRGRSEEPMPRLDSPIPVSKVRTMSSVVAFVLLLGALGPASLASSMATQASKCTIRGTAADDTLIGTPHRDVICGGEGRDTIRGRGGGDRLLGRNGRDRIIGGQDGDRVVGGKADDLLFGGARADRVNGGQGWDVIVGGRQPDFLIGREGADCLVSKDGKSNDVVFGESGADVAIADPGDHLASISRLAHSRRACPARTP